MTDEEAGREDQLVVGTERFAGRIDLIQQDAGEESPSPSFSQAGGTGSLVNVCVRTLMRQTCNWYSEAMGEPGNQRVPLASSASAAW